MRRDLLIAAAAGALGGLLLAAASHGSVLGVLLGLMFSPMPLAMVTLGLGLAYLPLAVASGAVAMVVITGSFGMAVAYAIMDAAPVAILMRIGAAAERTGGDGGPHRASGQVLGLAVVALALAAAMVMAGGLASLPTGADGLEAVLRNRLHELVAEVQSGATGNLAPDAAVAEVARILPGLAAWNWAFRALASAAIAQALLARDGFARWPTPAYRTLAVPGWYIGVFGAAVLAGLATSGDARYIAANAAIALSLPLVLQGLAVVHAAVAEFGLGRMALIVFYGVSLVALVPAMALVAMLGVMEHFLHMRARLTRRSRDGGE